MSICFFRFPWNAVSCHPTPQARLLQRRISKMSCWVWAPAQRGCWEQRHLPEADGINTERGSFSAVSSRHEILKTNLVRTGTHESMLGCWIFVWRGCISKYQIVLTISLCGGDSWIPISIFVFVCLCSGVPMAEKNRTPGNREKLATTSPQVQRRIFNHLYRVATL